MCLDSMSWYTVFTPQVSVKREEVELEKILEIDVESNHVYV